jgi:glucose/mannose-6-phosphate isomerase
MDDILYPIHSFKEQFGLDPLIVNKEKLVTKKNIVICGMGGSIICGSLLKTLYPEILITLHNNYDLPVHYDKENTLFIITSYSGTTEETISSLEAAITNSVSLAVLSKGGELIKRAEEHSLPHIVLPEIGLEPRFAIGHQMIGLLHLMGHEEKVNGLREAVSPVDITNCERDGKTLAGALSQKYPILYASHHLYHVAYLIKATINEGAKIPCFINIIPEANHNEMQGFVSPTTNKDRENFVFVFLTSPGDHPRVARRFAIMTELYHEEGFGLVGLSTDHTNHTKIFELILTGYFAATFLALARNVDTYKTPFIAKFKERII